MSDCIIYFDCTWLRNRGHWIEKRYDFESLIKVFNYSFNKNKGFIFFIRETLAKQWNK